MSKENKTSIDKYFEMWVSASPESWHDLDMNKFYTLTWACCICGKKHRGYEWLKEKINNSEHNLTKDDIDKYCNLFIKLQKFASYKRFWRKHNKTYNK